MDSRVNRRLFLRQGLMLAGGTMLLPVREIAFGASAAKLSSRPVTRILELISAFGRNATYQGATVAAIVDGRTPVVTSFRAEILNFAAFANACSSWRAYDFNIVRAAGSTVTVLASDQLFEIEALPANEYSTATASAASHAVFAHDALSLTPGATQAIDPLNASNSLRLIRQSSGASALADILRGRIDAAESGLTPDAAFLRTEASVLAGTVSDSASGDGFARTFFSHVTALASALPPAQMEALANSRLISSAVQARLGVSIEAVARSASMKTRGTSAAAIWLAGGLAAEIQAGRGTRWIATDSVARLVAATTALTEAESLIAPVRSDKPAQPHLMNKVVEPGNGGKQTQPVLKENAAE